ncbi:MAG: acylneuraminate cytidylyltransferase family protein [Candidatus Omnitrophica bacterium]|nr:acylneuraminate cytidylyltransferase family protein [Candidatus Omnitrophota bacterium]
MFKNFRILCVIPARGGSKGLPGKNIKMLCGKPLIAYSIEQARLSKYIDRVIVSSDDKKIHAVAKRCNAELPFVRPRLLSGDNSSSLDVLVHAVRFLEEKGSIYDIVVLLLVTSPLRTPQDIDRSIELLVKKKADNVFSVTKAQRNPYFNMVELDNRGAVRIVKKGVFYSRQKAPKVFDMNASIYVWWKDVLLGKKKLFLKNTFLYLMPKDRSFDIDDITDFRIVEAMMARNRDDKKN